MRNGRVVNKGRRTVRRESDPVVMLAWMMILAGLLLCGGVGYTVWMLGRHLQP